METKGFFWGGGYPTLLPDTSLHLFSIRIRPRRVHFLPPLPLGELCSGMFSAADMNNGAIAAALLEGAPRQFALIVLKLPGRENHLFCLML